MVVLVLGYALIKPICGSRLGSTEIELGGLMNIFIFSKFEKNKYLVNSENQESKNGQVFRPNCMKSAM